MSLKPEEANKSGSFPANPPFSSVCPKAKPKPTSQKARAPAHASNKFLIRMFFEFLLRTEPFSTRAKPSYMSRMKAVATTTSSSLIATLMASKVKASSVSHFKRFRFLNSVVTKIL